MWGRENRKLRRSRRTGFSTSSSLHDGRQMRQRMAPLQPARAMQPPVARQEREFHGASDHFQRRLDGASDV